MFLRLKSLKSLKSPSRFCSFRILLLCILLTLSIVWCCTTYLAMSASAINTTDLDTSSSFLAVFRRLRGTPTESETNAATRAELGRNTWHFLHKVAAKFSKTPTNAEQRQIETFFNSLGDIYPCEECASHFKELIATKPIEGHTSSNAELSIWLCEIHNEVNIRLDKPIFPCTLDALKEKWGSCGCFDNSTTTKILNN
jgi:FAD-linked sulfhydryl oxidase